MSSLVSISPNANGARDDLANSTHKIDSLPVVVLSPHNQCSCRCVMCDIWRIQKAEEIRPEDFDKLIGPLRQLKVRWVVFTGGEPELNSNLFLYAARLRAEGMRVTILTAGLLLADHAQAIASNIDDLIVSLDGPRELHDRIRRVPDAFDRLGRGIAKVRQYRPDIPLHGRCTVQKLNRSSLRETIAAAKNLGLHSISFLAADVSSNAFNHAHGSEHQRREHVALNLEESAELEAEIEAVIQNNRSDVDSGFISENPNKLRRIGRHFRADLGQLPHIAPRCNAPWSSAVIDSSGNVQPCFFHPPLGNLRDQTLGEILNGPIALQFRNDLDIAHNTVCRRCVCSLYVSH